MMLHGRRLEPDDLVRDGHRRRQVPRPLESRHCGLQLAHAGFPGPGLEQRFGELAMRRPVLGISIDDRLQHLDGLCRRHVRGRPRVLGESRHADRADVLETRVEEWNLRYRRRFRRQGLRGLRHDQRIVEARKLCHRLLRGLVPTEGHVEIDRRAKRGIGIRFADE